MTRKSKQARRRAVSPRRHRAPSLKTGSKRDALEFGYRVHKNAVCVDDSPMNRFIPKMS